MLMDEAATLARVLEGDQEAFREFVLAYQESVVGYASVLVGRGDAEDVAQEAFLAAFQNLSRYRPSQGALRSWLLGITRHRALRCLETRRRSATTMEQVPRTAITAAAGPEDQVRQRELFARMDAAFSGLAPSFRAAFALHHWQGMSYDEIAHVEGVAVGTVKSRIARARRAIERAMVDVERTP